MDSQEFQILSNGYECKEEISTKEYFTLIARSPERIARIIEYVQDQDNPEVIRMSLRRDDQAFPLIQILCHLRDSINSLEVDPFSREAIMGRAYSTATNFPDNKLRVVMPEEGDTHFVQFVFQDIAEEQIVMDKVEERGFENFISSTVEN